MTDEQYEHLLRSRPRFIREMVEGQATLIMFLSALGVVTFLASRSLHLWAMAGSAILGPVPVSLFLLIKPLNPYESLYAQLEGKSFEAARKDPYIVALIELLKSKTVKVCVIRIGVMIAFALSVIVILIARAQGPINVLFDRSRDPNLILGNTFLLSFGCLGVEATLVLRAALKILRDRG